MNTYTKLSAGLMATLALSLSSFGDDHSKPELSPLNVVGSNADAPTLSSGLKSSLSPNKLPQSNSVMSSDQIKAQGLKSVGDIIDYTPGVVNSQGEGHRDAMVIRGIRTTQDFYLDGVRDDVQYYRPLYNVESVEVLRGPNALVSGYGAGYGLINRVSKKGILGDDFTVLSGSIDTFGEHNVQLDKNMDLNDNTALRVNIFGESLENHRDFYYGDGFGINPTLFYDLGDGSTLNVSYEFLDQERFIDRGIPTGDDNKPVESLKDYVFGDPSQNYSTHEAHIFRAIYEHDITDTWSGRLSASHSNHDKLYVNMYASDYNSTANTVKLNGYIDTTQRKTGILSYDISGEVETGGIVHNIIAGIEYSMTDNDNDRFYADFDTQRGLNTNLNAGKDYAYETFDISRKIISNNVGYLEGNTSRPSVNNYIGGGYDDTHGEQTVFSIYLQDEINLTDSLDLVLGVRFDSIDYDVDNVLGGTSLSDSDETVSPKVGLIFSATDELAFYASYSETFSPLAGDQYASLKSWYSDYDPKSYENTEFGLRYDFASGLSFSASYFGLDSITPSYDEDANTSRGEPEYYNSEQEITGFELQLVGTITDNWYISAAYTSLDAETSGGKRLRETPEHVFSIWNNFLVSDRLSVNFGVINQGKSHIKDGSDQVLPEYTRVDVGASYLLSENTRVQLNVENLLDELYFPHSHSTHQASVGAPINATFGITSSF